MHLVTVVGARKAPHKLVLEAASCHEPVLIAGRNAKAVLVSEEDWNPVNETLHLLSFQGMRASIIEGLGTPLEHCDEFIKWQHEEDLSYNSHPTVEFRLKAEGDQIFRMRCHWSNEQQPEQNYVASRNSTQVKGDRQLD